MSKLLKFKCRLKNGSKEFELPYNATYQNLVDTISSISGRTADGFKILAGYPPKEFTSTDPESSLASLGICGNILFTIREVQTKDQSLTLQEEIAKQFDDKVGFFTKHVVNADNSCLFSSINYLINDLDSPSKNENEALRAIVVSSILSDPLKYSETFLEMNPQDYCRWISDCNAWGGAIELDVLSAHYRVQINVVDVTVPQIIKFGENLGYHNMVFMVYNGSHYDGLIFEFGDPSFPSQRRFSTATDTHLFENAFELAKELKNLVTSFICCDCNAIFYGNHEIANHSKITGHVNYTN